MTKRVFLMFLLVILTFSCIAWGDDKPLYLDDKATPEQRTEDLLARMTLREKLGQITQIEIHRLMNGFWSKGPLDATWLKTVLVDYGVGSILSGGDGAPVTNSPEEYAKMTNQVQEWSLKSRLKIPVLYGIDAVHGHNNVIGATIYPYHIGLAASFNPELAKEYAALTADEVAATGIQWTFAPVLDVAVDPRWGRTLETYGEDPYLVSVMGSHEIQGFQSSGKIIACAKHFTGYSAPQDGHDRHPAVISEREFREIHFPPYFAAIKANVGSVMVNSGAINGTPAHASKWLLTDILRKEMGFQGLVVSDWQDIEKLVFYHHVAKSNEEALALSYNAGMELNMQPMDVTVVDSLEKLVNGGKIPVERINDAVRHVLLVKFRLGLFEKRTVDPAAAAKIIGSDPSHKVARTAALQSMTLLRNENQMLPISKNVKSLLVAGTSADSLSRLCGGWTIHWMGAVDSELSGQTVLGAIKTKVGSGTKVTYIADASNSGNLVKAAKGAEITVVVVGEAPYAEEHGDSPTLRLSGSEEKIIQTLQNAKLPFVLVVTAGRPIILPGAEQAAPAILWAFQPGTEGGPAIADVLFGDYNPSGRLPISFPRNAGKPRVAYYHANGKDDVIYPFGYGLSYTEFSGTDLQAPTSVKIGQSVKVTVKVKNTGKLPGDHVVLLFINGKKAELPLFEKQLVGFARVSLAPGEEKSVTLEIKPEQLSFWDANFRFVEKPCSLQLEAEGKTGELKVVE